MADGDLLRIFQSLERSGVRYRPRAPVPARDLADPHARRLEDLVAIKRGAGRAKDLDDVAALEALAKETGDV